MRIDKDDNGPRVLSENVIETDAERICSKLTKLELRYEE